MTSKQNVVGNFYKFVTSLWILIFTNIGLLFTFSDGGGAGIERIKNITPCVNVTFVFIHVTSIVKPMYIFMERSRVCKSLIEAKLCFHSFVHFGSVPIYRYVFSAFTTSSVLANRRIIYLSVCLSIYLSTSLSIYRHFSHVTKSRIFKNLNLREKADRNFRCTFLKNRFRHLKLY